MAAKKKATAPKKKGRPAKSLPARREKKNPADTQFAPGNQLWKLRKHVGKPRIFETPEALWDAACQYFDWATANPLLELKIFCNQGIVIREDVPRLRAFSISALNLFLGIGKNTLDLYRKREEFADVVEAIEAVIWSQKFEAAAADQMNAMIVAREIGLKEANSHEHTGKDGGPIETSSKVALLMAEISKEQAEAVYKDLLG